MRKVVLIIFISSAVSEGQKEEQGISKAQDVETLCPNERCQQWQDENENMRNLLNGLFFRYYYMKAELSTLDAVLQSNFMMAGAGAVIFVVIVLLKIIDSKC